MTVSADGKHSDVVDEWTGHSDLVRSAAFNKGILVTGGEDGKLVVKNIDLRYAFFLFYLTIISQTKWRRKAEK